MRRPGSWWQDRPARERRVIAYLLALAALAILFALGLQAERTRERLAGELPRLRASLAALERDGQEAKRLRAMPAPTPLPAAPLAAFAASAGAVAGAQVAVIDERRVRLTGADVSFASLLEWLGQARASHGLRVESARLEALAAPGRVRAELVLARS
ncbi:MAG TPA: type II secretion system protein GspM [Usitatibacter sp.]|nr:type II secretion system protein GspM [Usitatibacter sp.]